MRPLAFLCAACAALACSSKPTILHGCSRDEDCGDPAVYRCDLETGECRCKTDAACKDGEFCNPQGYCQAHVGCYETRDCPNGFFCDPSTNLCLPDGRCASDMDCPAGQLCDPATQTCKPGCRVDGDCSLREVCLCASGGDGGAGEDLCGCSPGDGGTGGCPLGRCATGFCRSDGFCAWGEVCRAPAGGGAMTCQSDVDTATRPYCADCVDLPGQNSCGTGANFCLWSPYTGNSYCGVDCSENQPCANGYECRDVIRFYSRGMCASPDQCKAPENRSTLTCQKDEDCHNHGLCGHDPGAPVGFCYGHCTLLEGATKSYCGCITDDDCPQDICVAESRTCSGTLKNCDPNGAGCGKIHCVDAGDKSGCMVGQNCKPIIGLTCADVRPQQ